MKIIHSSNEKYTISDISVKDITKQRYCVFDFEATGPDPNEDCITQIGAVNVDSLKIKDELTFCSLVHSPKLIPEKIERLTGIRNQDIAEAPVNYYRIQDQDLKRHDALGDSKLIARILICILQEYKSRGTTDLVIDTPINIRKVKLPPLK